MTDQLLAHLQARAGTRGLVHVREDALLQEVQGSKVELSAGLQSLEDAGAIRILSPVPYLVLWIKKWSAKPSDAENSGTSAYSHSKQLLQTQQLKDSYRHDGSAESANGELLAEVLETLGESDAASFEKAIELYSPHVIRIALDRVRRARTIRKSRTALFRHLLPRLARESQNPN
jgi:hypothetical protein